MTGEATQPSGGSSEAHTAQETAAAHSKDGGDGMHVAIPIEPVKVISAEGVHVNSTGELDSPLLLEPIDNNIPAVTIRNAQDASRRIAVLKLRMKRIQALSSEEKKDDDAGMACMFVVCCLLLGPLGIIIALIMSQQSQATEKGEAERLRSSTSTCVKQINLLNQKFKDYPGWTEN